MLYYTNIADFTLNSFEEFYANKHFSDECVKVWSEIFEEFFDGLDDYDKYQLAFSFEYAANRLQNNSVVVKLLNLHNKENCLELNIFPIIYGVFSVTQKYVILEDILFHIITEKKTKYDYDFVMNAIKSITKQ